MNTLYGRLAVLTALASAAVLVPAAPAAAQPPEELAVPASPNVEVREAPQSVFAGTAIGAVLEANGNEVPKNGEQMMKVLATFGDFVQLPITFSAVDLQSGLTKPRLVITQRPSFVPLPKAKAEPAVQPFGGFQAFGGFGGFQNFDATAPTQAALGAGTLTKPNLEGRLFLAANLEKKGNELKVKTFEFISWNSKKQKFDFGFIECDETEPQIRVVDGVRCFSCHKNKGPILSLGPWSNTPHNDMVRQATMLALRMPGGPGAVRMPTFFDNDLGQPRRLDTGFSSRVQQGANVNTVSDGLIVFQPQGPAVDASVRLGSDLIRDRDVYRAMIRTADGRRGFAVLLGAIALPGPIEQNNQFAKVALEQAFTSSYPNFADRWQAIHKNSSSTLVDFNPSGSQGSLQQVVTGSAGGWGGGSTLQSDLRIVWTGDPKQVSEYDAKRSDGEHGLPSHRQPSNPRAFVKAPAPLPGKPSVAVNAMGLARLIGLTEGDRAFFAMMLADAAGQIGKKITPSTIAKEVFASQPFVEVLTAGEIPDREDFKDRFVKGLNVVMKARGANEIQVARRDYASGPNIAPGKGEIEPVVVATTACLRCHDVRGAGKVAFNPIPMLAFDPFDKASRDAWVKATPAKTRAQILARMNKRLIEDRDMPPEDSAEYDAFRAKTPAAFEAVKVWIDAELQKAK